MSNSYVRSQHLMHLYSTLVVQFVILSLVFGSAIWVALLRWHFGGSWQDVPRWTWTIVQTSDLHWHAHLGLCLLAGVISCAWLFTWLNMRGRLQSGDRHHRGSRVVHHAQD